LTGPFLGIRWNGGKPFERMGPSHFGIVEIAESGAIRHVSGGCGKAERLIPENWTGYGRLAAEIRSEKT